MERKTGESGESNPHNGCVWNCKAGIALTVIGMLLAPKILVLMGTPTEVLPESITYFRTYFAGSIGVIMYNIFCRDFAVGWRQQTSADLSDHFFLYQCGAGYFLYFRIGDGSRCGRFGNSDFPIYKCILMSDSSSESKKKNIGFS